MTKAKLMEFLHGVSDDTIVIVQTSDEGEGSLLYEVVDMNYEEHNDESGTIYEDPSNLSVPCIVLIPTN